MHNTTTQSFLSSKDISISIADDNNIVQSNIIKFSYEENTLIYQYSRKSPLPMAIQCFWMDSLASKFIRLNNKNQFHSTYCFISSGENNKQPYISTALALTVKIQLYFPPLQMRSFYLSPKTST